MREHQLEWAVKNGIGKKHLEIRSGKLSHVLKKDYSSRNLYNPKWISYIKNKEHKLFRSMISSQAFAVNLYAPFIEDSKLSGKFLSEIIPHYRFDSAHLIKVVFEHAPVEAAQWLGESGQSTQVDVFFKIYRGFENVGCLLIEVKFTEEKISRCKGSTKKTNLNHFRCNNLQKIIENPRMQCYMVEIEKRKYWDHMLQPDSDFNLHNLSGESPCPFKNGLYQLMRNGVLAQEIRNKEKMKWARFGLTFHPDNKKVRTIDDVQGSRYAIDAYNVISKKECISIDPYFVINLVSSQDDTRHDWARWMIERYRLNPHT